MSGGHFDYMQYHIEDIADSIEREIEEAAKPKPPKVWREGVVAYQKLSDGFYIGIKMDFKAYDEAVLNLKRHKKYYSFLREYEKNQKRISEFVYDGKFIEVRETKYQEHEDGGCYPEYTDETIQIFKDAVRILRKAAIYAQRIDWVLSGDDGEDTLKERLEEDLKQLEEES